MAKRKGPKRSKSSTARSTRPARAPRASRPARSDGASSSRSPASRTSSSRTVPRATSRARTDPRPAKASGLKTHSATPPRRPTKRVEAKKPAAAAGGRRSSDARSLNARTAKGTPRLERARRRLAPDVVPTPPSSLNLERKASAARSGRAELAERLDQLRHMNVVVAGDVDADAANAFFSGEEAPGGDTPTPDQDIVDDIGRAMGVQYQDNEELRGSDKILERDRHRWELDPSSSEDYKDRK